MKPHTREMAEAAISTGTAISTGISSVTTFPTKKVITI
jgi:hypothetical protein